MHFNDLCIHAYNCVQTNCARVVSLISKQLWRERDIEVRQYKVINGQAMNCCQKVTNALQTPNSPIASGEEVESNEVVEKKKCVNKEQRKDPA